MKKKKKNNNNNNNNNNNKIYISETKSANNLNSLTQEQIAGM